MLTILDYGNICNDVYGQPFKIQRFQKPSDVNHSGILRMANADPTMNINKSFYAQLYINFRNGEAVDAVAAYRGTVITQYSDLEVDMKSWYKSVVEGNQSIDSLPGNHFTDYAARFYRTCRDYLAKHFPSIRLNRLHVTGHSLGGALAALIPTIYGFPATAITFNAPGIGTMPGVHSNVGNRIVGVEARYDFVSKVGQHIEKNIYLVDVPNMENIAKQAFALNDEETKLQDDMRQTRDEFVTPFKTIHNDSTLNIVAEDASDTTKMMYDNSKIKVDRDIMANDFFLSAYAQHKIDNLVNALKEPTYSALANQLIV